MATGSGGPSRSGGTSDTSSKRAKKATSTRKRASPHHRPTPEVRPQRDEAARARNARNQQLHRQRQRVRHLHINSIFKNYSTLCRSPGRGAALGRPV